MGTSHLKVSDADGLSGRDIADCQQLAIEPALADGLEQLPMPDYNMLGQGRQTVEDNRRGQTALIG